MKELLANLQRQGAAVTLQLLSSSLYAKVQDIQGDLVVLYEADPFMPHVDSRPQDYFILVPIAHIQFVKVKRYKGHFNNINEPEIELKQPPQEERRSNHNEHIDPSERPLE